MIATTDHGNGNEVSKDEPCPICHKPDWCFLLPDGAINCKRETHAPDGWVRASQDSKDGFAIFQPLRNKAIPRSGRELPTWKRTGNHDDDGFEKQIIFQYSDTQRVIRKQWSDRRSVYKQKNGKLKSKLVIPQYRNGEAWAWGKGDNEWPLYRSDDLLPTDVLFFVGGEICVETLRKWGFSATCNQGGEGNRLATTIKALKELRFFMLVVIPDNDKAGMSAADELIEAATTSGIPAAVLSPLELQSNAPQKWDVADWEVEPDEAQSKIKDAVSRLRPKTYEAPTLSEKAQNLKDALTQYTRIDEDFDKFVYERDVLGGEHGLRGKRLEVLADIVAPPQPVKIRSFADNSDGFIEDLMLKQQGMLPPGIATGFMGIDRITEGGLQRGDLNIIAGRPSMGKTSLCLAMAWNVATLNNLPVVLFSLEMTEYQVKQRLISALTNIPVSRIRAGRISDAEVEQVISANMEVDESPLRIDDSKRIDTRYIESACNRVMDDTGQPLGMAMVDYLSNMKVYGNNRTEAISQAVRDLKDMAGIINAPVNLVSQLNRDLKGRTNKRPTMEDLRETGEIEQQADSIAMVYRDEYYHPDTIDRGIGEVIYVKQRQGQCGTVKLMFEPEYTRFRDLPI
jgi:hypothetical protein